MSSDDTEDSIAKTTDHALIRAIVEERNGYPAHAAKSEGQGDHGLLEIGHRNGDEDYKELSWEQFFAEFDAKELAFVYPETADSGTVGWLEKQSA